MRELGRGRERERERGGEGESEGFVDLGIFDIVVGVPCLLFLKVCYLNVIKSHLICQG